MNITDDITTMISNLCRIPREELNPDTRIYDSTIISSLNLLELISMFEQKYKILIDPEDLIEENFKDLKSISNYVQTRIE